LREELDSYSDEVWFSEEDKGNVNCPHAFSITLRKGNLSQLTKHLEDNGIEWKRNFGSIPTQQDAFRYLNHKYGKFPNAEWVGSNGIHVGVHQGLHDSEMEYLIKHLKRGLDKCLTK
jgi:CDP-6-deoxy-D-xylo-4-hexulose-3-dehydrase